MPVAANEALDLVAYRIRKAYTRLRCRVEGIEDFVPGSRWNKYWLRAGRICIENGINPEEFVEVQFTALKPYPYIPALATSAAVRRFMDKRHSCAVDVASSVMLQLDAFERLVKFGKQPHKALEDGDEHGFDPLFVFVTASVRGYTDLADRAFDDALMQYLCSTHYDLIYKDALPEVLKETAKRIRKKGMKDDQIT